MRQGRNVSLSSSSHVNRLSKSALKQKKGVYKRLDKPAAKPKDVVDPAIAANQTKSKKVGGSKNGETRLVPVHKASRYYPAEDTAQLKKTRKSTPSAPTLRKSITPGTVLILLAGKYRGKRVVALKQLASGLLLVSGPFKLNGVPIRRVNQAYVIATSTKLDISSVKVDDKFNDDFFKNATASRVKGSEAEFFKDGDKKPEPTAEEKEKKAAKSADQKSLDKSLLEAVNKTPNMAKYLASPFSLSKGQFPHLMKF